MCYTGYKEIGKRQTYPSDPGKEMGRVPRESVG